MGFVPVSRRLDLASSACRVDEALRRNLVAYVPQSEEVDWNFPVLVEDVVMMGRYGHMSFLRIAGDGRPRRGRRPRSPASA